MSDKVEPDTRSAAAADYRKPTTIPPGLSGIGAMSRSTVIKQRREMRFALVQDTMRSEVYRTIITGNGKAKYPRDLWLVRELESNVSHQLNLLAVTHAETCRMVLALEKQIAMSLQYLTVEVSTDSAIAMYIKGHPHPIRLSATKHHPNLLEEDVSQHIVRFLHVLSLLTTAS